MRRKLVQQGQGTMTVSLPKKWVDRFGLENGGEVDISEINTRVIVEAPSSGTSTTRYFDCSKMTTNLLTNFFIGLYNAGVKDFELQGLSAEQVKRTSKLASEQLGFEVVKSSAGRVHIIDIGSGDEEKLKQIEQQIFWKLQHMIDSVFEGKNAEEIKEIDTGINRLCFFTQRQFSLHHAGDSKSFLKFQFISVLEEIGDSIRFFHKHSGQLCKEHKFILTEVKKHIDVIRKAHAIPVTDITTLAKEPWNALSKKTVKLKEQQGKGSLVQLMKLLEQLYEISIAYSIDAAEIVR